ncbi:protein TIC 40, chloroplastic isoform X2 [Cryptomeria japonica]|uniref:protein TIC 40, chloroplastic isoform X2 n=1 Tax=Cryptomeria japonica TaxID=3369 RepID=UPI0027DA165B|nr:protein TIC 40, chloroplastic isoform X2 [Cryptomeria japonica]
MAANLTNPGLLLHQPFLPARPAQRTGSSACFSGSSNPEIRISQRKLWRKFNGSTAKVGRKDFQCKAQAQDSGVSRRFGLDQSKVQLLLASISNSGAETSSVGSSPPNPQFIPPPPTLIGSPLLWIGIGVGISALFSWVASSLKRYAMQQLFKNITGQATPGGSQFGGMAMPAGSGFPIPPFPVPPETRFASAQTVDVSASEVTTQPTQVNGAAEEKSGAVEDKIGAAEIKVEPKKPAFVDVSPEELLNQNAYGRKQQESAENNAPKTTHFQDPTLSQDQTFTKTDGGAASRHSQFTGNTGPNLTVEALEKMMEDPTVQKMVYPYLPPEMQNPDTFKWMMQNPQYRQQLEDMLNNMSGDATWDNRMLESLKNFDLNSQEVKQQFEYQSITSVLEP